jgi:hypothetical protein
LSKKKILKNDMKCCNKDCLICNIGIGNICIGFEGKMPIRRTKRITTMRMVSFLAIVLEQFNLDKKKL